MSIRIWGAFNSRTEHESFHLDIAGEPCYMLVHFHNPVEITLRGSRIITEPNACVIFAPDTPREYRSLRGGFTNDYVKFTYEDEQLLEHTGLPLNELFYVDTGWIFEERISRITWWLTDVMNDHTDEMAEALRSAIEELCQNRIDVSPKAKRDSLTAMRLRQIRSEISASPGEWTVGRMAKSFYMTRSHFSVLYKKQFGISPGEDIYQLTMQQAAKLLESSSLSVDDISKKCGYSGCENFIRSFKKYFGITPLRYRSNNKQSS